ncbi:hypothetical protein ARMGADRAFT_280808 [Armillaria gallica]|uniref:Uncharacterized protein n=1 Tax=Armillaria gallica TaxID=47427 RepID=A0A2H3EJU8_ARMGA|nr:hypothetical protein ARMGADRAFT_280808 [Armillaria gallica]
MLVSISGHLGRRKNDLLSILRAALSYSRRCLLSLWMKDGGLWLSGWDAEAREISESLLKILLSQSQRWKSVIISISPGFFHLLPPLRGKIPELEAFDICIESLEGDVTGTFDGLEIAPRLKHLVFEEWGFGLIPVIEASHLPSFYCVRTSPSLNYVFLDGEKLIPVISFSRLSLTGCQRPPSKILINLSWFPY